MGAYVYYLLIDTYRNYDIMDIVHTKVSRLYICLPLRTLKFKNHDLL